MAAAVLAAAAATGAAGQTPLGQIANLITDDYRRCVRQAASDAERITCAAAEFARQDARLNARYRQVIAALRPRPQARLREAQRAWIRWRDTRCRSLADVEGGVGVPPLGGDCTVTMTVERLVDLERYPPQETR